MQKRMQNSTYHDRRARKLLWHVEWIFLAANLHIHDWWADLSQWKNLPLTSSVLLWSQLPWLADSYHFVNLQYWHVICDVSPLMESFRERPHAPLSEPSNNHKLADYCRFFLTFYDNVAVVSTRLLSCLICYKGMCDPKSGASKTMKRWCPSHRLGPMALSCSCDKPVRRYVTVMQ